MNARVTKATHAFDEVQRCLDTHDAVLGEINQSGLSRAFGTMIDELPQ